MTKPDLIEALERDLWKASEDQLLIVAGVLGWDVRATAENLEES